MDDRPHNKIPGDLADGGDTLSRYTSGSLIARNTLWSLSGQSIPWLVAIVAIPYLVSGYGVDKFGVLTIFWVVIGYFSYFDLGLSRALTKLVAEKLGANDEKDIPAIVWTSLTIMLAIGAISAGVVALLTPWLVHSVLKMPPEMERENLVAFYLLALSIPVIISSSGLRGLLEAKQRFGMVNAVRIPLGIYTFLAPMALLAFTTSLVPVVVVLIAGRLAAWLAHLILSFMVMPALRRGFEIRRSLLRPLLKLGSWMTISNIVGPFMNYVDRFLIGSMISVAAVAFYATPGEVVTKFLIIPGALVAVLFPAFSACYAKDPNRAARLFDRGVNHIFMILFPLTLVVITLSRDGLHLWLGEDFADSSTVVMQLMAAGVFFNGLAQIPFALLQSAGRPDLPAKMNMLEFPVYLALAWWLIGLYGISGAAIAWVARMAADMILLFLLTRFVLPASKPSINRLTPTLAGALALMLFGAVLDGIFIKGAFLALTLLVFAPIAWRLILTPRERAMVINHVKAIPLFS